MTHALTVRTGILALLVAAPAAMPAFAADAGTALAPIVIEATALPGSSVDVNAIPGNVQVLTGADLTRTGSASLTQALNASLSSVNVNDNLDDPFQPNILYRGFVASPVLGTPQGLAVYQNGVRINEAFGDTVDWDLFPDVAIRQVELVSANPVYGLNALGGAIAVAMKDGFTSPGGDLELSGGSFGRRAVVGQYGWHRGALGAYVGGRALDANGWRRFSSDRMRDLYASVGFHTDRGTLDLSYTRARNAMYGQSAVPIQELLLSRSLVFTGPQNNINTLGFYTLNGTLHIDDRWSMQGVLYYRDYRQTVANGNTTEYQACANAPGVLCQPDGTTPLTDASGATIPDVSAAGTVPIGENDFERIHSWSRGATWQITDAQPILGRQNHLTLGAAIDHATTRFYSGALIGALDPQLQVLPTSLQVFTPERSPAALANGDATPVAVDSVNRDLGVYLTDAYDVTRRITVTASGRYNVARIDLADQLGTKLSGRSRYTHFNPGIGATFKVVPAVTVYGGWSENTRTPTASEIECSDPTTPCPLPSSLSGDPPNLRQVVSRTTEAGVRGHWDRRSWPVAGFDWNLSAFRTLLKDDIYGIATSASQGFFQNIGDTRRQGLEAGLNVRARGWSAFVNYSFVQATFLSPMVVPSRFNPYADAAGDLHVAVGDRLPGIPEHRVKLGADWQATRDWTVGATINVVSSVYLVGDEANRLAPIPGFAVVGLHSTYRPTRRLAVFASITNLFNRRYETFGLLGDPTGVGAPGIPSNGIGVDPRFVSPAAPFEFTAGIRIDL